MSWTIQAKVLPLVHFGGHLYLDIFDDQGQRVAQINGLSVSRQTNKIIPIGRPGDKLKAFVSSDVILGATSNSTCSNHPHEGQIIFSGTKDDIEKIITETQKLAKDFNEQDFLYNVLQFNSNTVFSIMVHKISTLVTIDHKALNKTIALRLITPGVKKSLLQGKQSLKHVFNKGWKSRQHIKPQSKPNPPKPS